jgi:hypothetical protein
VSVASDDNSEIAPADEPIRHFKEWFAEASAHEPNDPDAMALATVDAAGLPNVRMVLLKSVDHQGFVFYTNLESPKGEELKANAKAALSFHWKSLSRQVRARIILCHHIGSMSAAQNGHFSYGARVLMHSLRSTEQLGHAPHELLVMFFVDMYKMPAQPILLLYSPVPRRLAVVSARLIVRAQSVDATPSGIRLFSKSSTAQMYERVVC